MITGTPCPAPGRSRPIYHAWVREAEKRSWTFLTNHGHLLVAISRRPRARIRDLAEEIGITERAAQLILRDLEGAGYIIKEKVGRRNEYTVEPDAHLRHPAESSVAVRSLLGLFAER